VVKLKHLLIFLSILLIVIIVSLKLNLSKVFISTSPLGLDSTPPGPAQYFEVPAPTTSQEVINLSGLAEANSTVNIFLNNNKIKEIKVEDNSTFNYDLSVEIGENLVHLIVIDESGNAGQPSGKVKVVREK
jgi:hypothetical protein